MKIKLLVTILALCCFITYAQTIVDDLNFEDYLEHHDAIGTPVPLGDPSSMGDGINGNGFVTTANINTVENLVVANLGITSLVGIEDFIALKRLTCNNNSISTLDLSSNINLEALYCHFNGMTSLTLPDTPTLYDLQCYQNSLTFLNVSNNEGLKVLWCYNNNIQNTFDASSCTILENFDCGFNQIDNIILPNDSNTLFRIECDNNNISSLNVSNNLALTWLKCDNNPNLLSLDVMNNSLLQRIYCYNNTLMSSMLLPTTNTLTLIDGFSTGLTSLDAIGLTGLNYLRLNNSNSLTNLILPNTSTLQTFWMYGHALSNIDFTPYTNLYTGLLYLDISNGNLTNVDVSMLQNLEEFYCYDSDLLTNLNIKNTNNSALIWMWAENNPLLDCIQVDNKIDADGRDTNEWRSGGATYEETCVLSTEEFDLSSISIYPNPSKDKFYIDLKMGASYSMINLFGQEIRKGSFVAGTNELDIQSLSNGLYLLNLETRDGKATKKIIKE